MNFINDETLEKRENELLGSIKELGAEMFALRHSLLGNLLPAKRRKAAALEVRLLKAASALDEVRELRRLMLGLAPQAHIRGRAVPNFVADNPAYAETVAMDPHTPAQAAEETGSIETKENA